MRPDRAAGRREARDACPSVKHVSCLGRSRLSYCAVSSYCMACSTANGLVATVALQLRSNHATRDRNLRSPVIALQAVPLHQPIEGRPIDAGEAGGFREVAPRPRDHALQELAVELGEQLVARVVVAAGADARVRADAVV